MFGCVLINVRASDDVDSVGGAHYRVLHLDNAVVAVVDYDPMPRVSKLRSPHPPPCFVLYIAPLRARPADKCDIARSST